MGAAGSALSLAIDVTPSTRANPEAASASPCTAEREESIFVTVFMTTEPLVQAALTCLSTKELGRVGTASPTLRMHEAIVEHMRTAMIATTAASMRIIALRATNLRLWRMLFPRDMARLTATGANVDGLYLPMRKRGQRAEDRAFAEAWGDMFNELLYRNNPDPTWND